LWEPEELYWGPEGSWLGDERYSGEDASSRSRSAAVQMGLIYVNRRPDTQSGPDRCAKDIARNVLSAWRWNDEEDRRADRRRSHLRQDATAPAIRRWSVRIPEAAPSRTRASLEEQAMAPAWAPTPLAAARK